MQKVLHALSDVFVRTGLGQCSGFAESQHEPVARAPSITSCAGGIVPISSVIGIAEKISFPIEHEPCSLDLGLDDILFNPVERIGYIRAIPRARTVIDD